MFWSTKLSGYWVVQSYEACVDVARRTDIFSSSYMLNWFLRFLRRRLSRRPTN